MLAEMNVQFASMQAAFAGVIQKAEQSTTTQLETGKQQTEALARLMEGLMVKLQEAADTNVTNIRSQLTMVVGDLAQNVGSLSQDFMAAAQNAMHESQASAQMVVEQTGNWSESTTRRLEALVNSIEARSGEFQAARATLLQCLHASLRFRDVPGFGRVDHPPTSAFIMRFAGNTQAARVRRRMPSLVHSDCPIMALFVQPQGPQSRPYRNDSGFPSGTILSGRPMLLTFSFV